MKKMNSITQTGRKITSFLMMFLLAATCAISQTSPDVKVNGNDVGSWFSQNWIWIVGLVALLVLILAFTGSSRRRSSTVVTDKYGDVKRSTTTTDIVE